MMMAAAAEPDDDFVSAANININNNDRLILVPSKYENSMIAFKPNIDLDEYYIYRLTKTIASHDGTSKSESYRCRGCERIKEIGGFASTMYVKDGRLVREPDGEHKSGCVTLNRVELEALKWRREMTRRFRDGDDDPRRVTVDTLMADSRAAFPDDEESARAFRQQLGSFSQLKRSLNKIARKRKGTNPTVARERRRQASIEAARRRKDGEEEDETGTAVRWLNNDGFPLANVRIQPNANGPTSIATPIVQPRRTITISRVQAPPAEQPEATLEYDDDEMAPPPTPTIGLRTMGGSGGDRRTIVIPRRLISTNNEFASTPSGCNVSTSTGNSASTLVSSAQPSQMSSPLVPPRRIVAMRTLAPPKPSDSSTTPSTERSIADVLQLVETARKKTRWESFGDYIAKTLESMSPESASLAAREIQDTLFRLQESSWHD